MVSSWLFVLSSVLYGSILVLLFSCSEVLGELSCFSSIG